MRPGRIALRTTFHWKLPLVLSLALAACGGGSTDQTTGFVGAWTFSSGSLAATCVGIPSPSPFDLTGLSVTFAKIDDATISLTAGTADCVVDFGVSGNKATVKANQKCMLALGHGYGTQTVSVTTWTLTRTGDRIDSDVTGAVLFCSVSGPGVLARGSLDASAPDASGSDGAAGADGGDGSAGADGGPSDAATDVAGDAATDVAGDAATDVAGDMATGADAGVDAPTETGDAPAAETGADAGDAATAETGD